MTSTSHVHSWSERGVFCAFVASLMFLAFLTGAAVVKLRLPSYGLLQSAWRAALALSEERSLSRQKYPENLWCETRYHEQGVTVHEETSAYSGYTLYTSGHDAVAILVDMDGTEVQRWGKPFSHVWPNPTHVRRAPPDNHIYFQRARAFPNGDLLAFYESPTTTPQGLGMVKLDRDSKVIWTYADNVHHDFDVGSDGSIYCLTNAILPTPPSGAEFLEGAVLNDYLVALSPNGKEQQRVSIVEALANSNFRYVLDTFSNDRTGDVTHANTVNVVGAEFAKHYRFVEAGQIMTCLRNVNLVAVIDMREECVVWATRGFWHLPHDPDPLSSGRIMIFDNKSVSHHSGSRVIEFNPLTQRAEWIYGGSAGSPLYSNIRSCQQRLPNGNVVITESDAGRVLEVTRTGEIVWEYINPVRGGDAKRLTPVVSGGLRYSREELPFLED